MGDVHRIMIVFSNTTLGQTYTTHMDVEQDPGGGAPPIAQVGDAVKEWWDVGLNGANPAKQYYKTTTQLDLVRLRRIKPLENVVQEYTTGLPIAGTDTGELLAGQIAILASLRTAQIGRSYRGRMYLPAPTEAFESSVGAMDASVAQDIADGLWGLVLELDVPTAYSPVVFSELLDEGTGITRVLVDRRFRTQRRRAIENTLYVQGA